MVPSVNGGIFNFLQLLQNVYMRFLSTRMLIKMHHLQNELLYVSPILCVNTGHLWKG